MSSTKSAVVTTYPSTGVRCYTNGIHFSSYLTSCCKLSYTVQLLQLNQENVV